jgi:hypothetical protein
MTIGNRNDAMVGEPLVISVAREADNPGSRAQTDAPHRCAFVTPGPTSSTMPARSLPWPDGNVAGQRSANTPFRMEGLVRINARSLDPNKDRSRPRGWAINFHHLQNFEPTILIESHCTRRRASPLKGNTARRCPSIAPRFSKPAGSVRILCRSCPLSRIPSRIGLFPRSGNQRAPTIVKGSCRLGNGISTR